jgi:hypothetical protein
VPKRRGTEWSVSHWSRGAGQGASATSSQRFTCVIERFGEGVRYEGRDEAIGATLFDESKPGELSEGY